MDRTDRILHYIIHRFSGRLGRTRAVKLLFLADLESVRSTGKPLTDLDYTMDKFGPFDSRFYRHLDHLLGASLVTEATVAFEEEVEGRVLSAAAGPGPDLGFLGDGERGALERTVDGFGSMSRSRLLDHVYALPLVREAGERGSGARVPIEKEAGMYAKELGGIPLERVLAGEDEAEQGKVVSSERVESGLRARVRGAGGQGPGTASP